MKSKKKNIRFKDGIVNFPARIGGFTNITGASRYMYQSVSFDRIELEAAYQSSWMARLAVDTVAEDMTREGIEIQCEDESIPEILYKDLDELCIFDKISETIKWSRLYGGALALILTEGDDMSKPLRYIRKGSFKGLFVVDRWYVTPSTELISTLGENFGKPEYYTLMEGSEFKLPDGKNKIHHSRVLRIDGSTLPIMLRQFNMGWGASILESMMPQLKHFDEATQATAQLLMKAYLRIYKIDGLREIESNHELSSSLMSHLQNLQMLQSFEGLTVVDKNDDMQALQYQFSGLPDIIMQFGQQVAGAIGVPLVRLFGQSPAGLNSTGESDMRMYYDNIKQKQNSILRSGLKRILDIMYRSRFGMPSPDDLTFEFRPLWQMSSEQRAMVAQTNTNTILSAFGEGLISQKTAIQELSKLDKVTGMFSSISREDIQNADDALMEPPPLEDNDAFNPYEESNEQSGANVPATASEAERLHSEAR